MITRSPKTDTATFLSQRREQIVSEAGAALTRIHARHYESAGPEKSRLRLEALFDRILEGVRSHDLAPVVGHAEAIAEERFKAGFDLAEVQAAFNALEEATWATAIADLDASLLAETLGMVTTVIGAGKDALARRYVSLAAETHAPSLDLRAMFAGTERA